MESRPKPLRLAFMGTPELVVPTLQALHQSRHDLVCVYTQPPRAKGRKQQLQNTPVHEAAAQMGVMVRHPVHFKKEQDVQNFRDLDLDIAVVAAYGLLLPQDILDAPRFGCLNIHPSLLPRWRGPAPIQYAIWKGDHETGVSLMQLEKAMDAGPIIAQKKEAITPQSTFLSLNQTLWDKGNDMLIAALDDIARDQTVRAKAQDDEAATYCKLLSKDQGRIDWRQSATEIDRQIRGLNPWPGTWCLNQDGRRIKILKATMLELFHQDGDDGVNGTILDDGHVVCGAGILKLEHIQPENKKPMDVTAALNGGYIKTGEVLS